MSLTNSVRPLDTCLTGIWIEGAFLEEDKSFEGNLAIQSKHSFLEPVSERRRTVSGSCSQAAQGFISKVRRDTQM